MIKMILHKAKPKIDIKKHENASLKKCYEILNDIPEFELRETFDGFSIFSVDNKHKKQYKEAVFHFEQYILSRLSNACTDEELSLKEDDIELLEEFAW